MTVTLTCALTTAAVAWLQALHPTFELLAQPALPTALLAGVGAVAAGWWRLPLRAAGFVLAAGLLTAAARPQLWPPSPTARHDARPLRLYVANLWSRNGDFAAIGWSIAAARADVVVLLEVTAQHAHALPALLPRHPHRTPLEGGPKGPRVVLASSRPLTAVRIEVGADGLEFAEAQVAAPDGPVRVVAVHLARPWPLGARGVQAAQLERVRQRLDQERMERIVVVGDFNATASGPLLRDLARRSHLTPAPARTGTWPAILPPLLGVAIDNAFVGPGLAVVDRRLGDRHGSDHRALVVDVAAARAAAAETTVPAPPAAAH